MPVMSEGIRSGVNWMRRNSRSSVLRQRADHQRLAQPGHAQQQDVAAAEQADEHVVDDRLLADDHLGDLFADPPARLAQRATIAASSLESAPGLPGRAASGRVFSMR